MEGHWYGRDGRMVDGDGNKLNRMNQIEYEIILL
jgi:hypothetical protein